jgi:hypothetical protein
MKPALPSHPASRRSAAPRGMILVVITLSLVVLLTFIIVGFFAATTVNRTVENASSSSVSARILAEGAVGAIQGEFINEIIARSDNKTVGSLTFYSPKTNADMVPQRQIPNLIGTTDPNFLNLIKQSGRPFFTGGTPAIFKDASNNSTANASADGRKINPSRWNAPMLTGGNFTAATAPNWIFVTPDGYSATATAGETVLGRFAFNIYDIGGLLDINAAGYAPRDATTNPPDEMPFKGEATWADLTALPGINPAAYDVKASWPPKWRVADDWTVFAGNKLPFYQRSGWLTPFSNSGGTGSDRMFASRQDLIRYAKANPDTFTPNSGLIPALQSLTTFSRTPAAPSLPFIDATTLGFPSSGNFSAAYASGGNFTGYRDDGTTYAYPVKAGTPVLHKKFSLSKLGRETAPDTYSYWLTPTGPGAGISAAAIKAVFGLEWDAPNERWEYTSPDDSSPATEIKTLEQVAPLGRAPDFFEILKAGINPDSLGGRQTQDGASKLTASERVRQESRDLHILRIGASMIDQADNDNYPTRIAFELGGSEIEAAGVEDLPYLFGVLFQNAYSRRMVDVDSDPDAISSNGTITSATHTGWRFRDVGAYAVPVLFNPHRQGGNATSAVSIRAEMLGGTLIDLSASSRAPGVLPFLDGLGSYGGSITLSSGGTVAPTLALDEFRSVPKTLNGSRNNIATSGFALFDLAPHVTGTFPAGLESSDQSAGKTFFVGNGTNTESNLKNYLHNVVSIQLADLRLALSYRAPNGSYRIYDALGGTGGGGWGTNTDWLCFGFNTVYQIYTDDPDDGIIDSPNYTSPGALQNVSMVLMKFDPRSSRYGLIYPRRDGNELSPSPKPSSAYGVGNYDGSGVAADGELLLGSSGANELYTYRVTDPLPGSTLRAGSPLAPSGLNLPPVDPYYSTSVFHYRPSVMAAGGTSWGSGAFLENIPDRPQDSSLKFRANDGFFTGNTTQNFLRGSPLTRASVNDFVGRPMVLQRPFRNVAELGHVFRDQPWKSVNLFHESSADLALPDLFQLSEVEPAVVAGKVNLNSATSPALKAVFRGAGKWLTANAKAFGNSTSSAQGDALATSASGTITGNSSLHISQALSKVLPAGNETITSNLGTVKAEREAFARSVAGMTQTRTWNLMIDVIAQAGRNTGGGNFNVQGESRYWVHLALDRFTGEVVDIQWEAVNE